jgi:hypothetical protein
MNRNKTYKLNNNIFDDEILNGGRYECNPNKNFPDICIESDKGIYKTKESCINDCETKYINKQLQEINIRHETMKFYLFIKDIIQNEDMEVYVWGGNALGLKVLQMIHQKYPDDDKKFEKAFNEFLKLDLIKDWDFRSITKKEITPEYRAKIDKISKKYNLVPRAKTFILYQTPKPIEIDDKAMFEISIVDSNLYSDLEIPLTSMRVRVTEYNLKYIFMFAKSFFSYKLKNEPFDFVILKRMLNKIKISIFPHKDGLYNITNDFDKGNINDDLINFIKEFSKNDINLTQFILTMLKDTSRIFYRLFEKNIPKTNKIKHFLEDDIKWKGKIEWLFDSKKIENILKDFIKNLGKKISSIYNNNYNKSKSYESALLDVSNFMKGVSFKRVQIDYDNLFTDESKKLIKMVFNDLIKEVGKNNILNISIQQNNKSKEPSLIDFIKFLINKELFN